MCFNRKKISFIIIFILAIQIILFNNGSIKKNGESRFLLISSASASPSPAPSRIVKSPENCTKFVNANNKIQSVVDTAQPGDVICVKAGIYNEQIVISQSGTASAPIILAAYPGEYPVIDGNHLLPGNNQQYAVLLKVKGDYVTLEGFEVKNSTGIGVYISGLHDVVRFCKIHHLFDAGLTGAGDFNTLEYNEVYEAGLVNQNGTCLNGDCSWPGAVKIALYKGHIHGGLIQGNLVHDNWGEGIYTGSEGTIIQDNTSYNNYSVNIYIAAAQNIIVRNNVVYEVDSTHKRNGNPAYLTIADETQNHTSNVQVTNNLLYGMDICEVCWTDVKGLSDISVYRNTLVEGKIQIKATNGTNIVEYDNCILQASQVPSLGGVTPGSLSSQSFSSSREKCTPGTGADLTQFQ